MATYAIGDIQGCADELHSLLETLSFTPGRDKLWVLGDLVNRGPKSLETLRLLHDLREHIQIVLGNHDLHLLAAAHGHAKLKKRDTLSDILAAPDKHTLLQWLQAQPLIHHDQHSGYTLVHAGLIPQWDVTTAVALGNEVSAALTSPQHDKFFAEMYGNQPRQWEPALSGQPRLRFITNVLTRIRYCDASGRLNLDAKGGNSKTEGYKPWFKWRANETLLDTNKPQQGEKILFGHWSTLEKIDYGNIHCLDTGCVWGGTLSARCIETGTTIQVPSANGISIE